MLRFIFILCLLCLNSLVVQALPPLKASSAKVDITPSIGDKVYSMKRGGLAAVESIQDSIYARILLLEQAPLEVVFVVLDLLYFGDTEVQVLDSVVRKQTGAKEIIISNTHTHSGFFVPQNLPVMAEKISDEIIKLRKNLIPVTLSYATTMVDEVYNRRQVKDGKVEMLWQNPKRFSSPAADSSLNVLSFQNKHHHIVSTFVNYTAHPVITMNFDKVEVSSDYPGVLTRELDRSCGGTSLFALGAAGDLNPYDAGIGPENGSFEKSAQLGKKLANCVLSALKTAQPYKHSHMIFKRDTVDVVFNGQIKKTNLYLLSFNKDLAIVCLPGELFSELGVAIKKASPFKNTLVMGYTNTSLGYIPTSRAADEGGYGAENVPVAKGTGELLVKASLEMLKTARAEYGE